MVPRRTLKVEGETMSKSKGNYYTFRDGVAKGFRPRPCVTFVECSLTKAIELHV